MSVGAVEVLGSVRLTVVNLGVCQVIVCGSSLWGRWMC